MLLLAALAASASEPPWVTTVQLPGASGPPAEACANPPRPPSPAPRVDRPEVEDPRTRGMLRLDVTPGAANPDLPADVRARATVAVDLTKVPVPPIEGAAAARRRVADVLRKAATRTVRIAMWGDSLTAADPYPSELRRTLQARYGNAGRGFLVPVAPWPSWNPVAISRCAAGPWRADSERTPAGPRNGLYGWAGVALDAASPASGWLQTGPGVTADTFELLYLRQPGGGTVRVRVDGEAPIPVRTDAPAPGPGVLRIEVPDGPHRVAFAAEGDGPVRLFGVHFDRDAPGIALDSMGVGGGMANDWSKWDEPLMAAFLARRRPELVIVGYGTNETAATGMTPDRYREELRGMLGKLRRVAPDAACVLVAPPDRGQKALGSVYAVWSHIEWVTRIQAEEAPTFGCATWSTQRAMGGLGSAFGWQLAGLMGADYLHPTPKGYEELGRRLGEALSAAE